MANYKLLIDTTQESIPLKTPVSFHWIVPLSFIDRKKMFPTVNGIIWCINVPLDAQEKVPGNDTSTLLSGNLKRYTGTGTFFTTGIV
jgi:hypothetical protein